MRSREACNTQRSTHSSSVSHLIDWLEAGCQQRLRFKAGRPGQCSSPHSLVQGQLQWPLCTQPTITVQAQPVGQ